MGFNDVTYFMLRFLSSKEFICFNFVADVKIF